MGRFRLLILVLPLACSPRVEYKRRPLAQVTLGGLNQLSFERYELYVLSPRLANKPVFDEKSRKKSNVSFIVRPGSYLVELNGYQESQVVFSTESCIGADRRPNYLNVDEGFNKVQVAVCNVKGERVFAEIDKGISEDQKSNNDNDKGSKEGVISSTGSPKEVPPTPFKADSGEANTSQESVGSSTAPNNNSIKTATMTSTSTSVETAVETSSDAHISITPILKTTHRFLGF